jgi:hypothetical protein
MMTSKKDPASLTPLEASLLETTEKTYARMFDRMFDSSCGDHPPGRATQLLAKS